MSVEPKTHSVSPLSGNTDLHLRPFAQAMAKEQPHLWNKFLRACEHEQAVESSLTPEEFIQRCTRATRRLIRETRARFVARHAA